MTTDALRTRPLLLRRYCDTCDNGLSAEARALWEQFAVNNFCAAEATGMG